jgi:predicted helicase
MACGAGKTFASLRIAENETKKDGLVLFPVPSIALLGQTLREWKFHSVKPICPLCICSDAGVSKTRGAKSEVDATEAALTDLALPDSTDKKSITRQFDLARLSQKKDGGLIVVFSTCQSIDVISAVQKSVNRRSGDFVFDLIICDEAHRATGASLAGAEESAFVKVRDDAFLKSRKPMCMTATPRIYAEADAELCSMDDAALYGGEMYRIGFGEAVGKKLLSDYKVIVLTI